MPDPFLFFPNEISDAIIDEILHQQAQISPDHVIFARSILALLSHHSHLLVYSNPTFWRSFSITGATSLEYVELCLRRSGMLPLRLEVRTEHITQVRSGGPRGFSQYNITPTGFREFQEIILGRLEAASPCIEALFIRAQKYKIFCAVARNLASFRTAGLQHFRCYVTTASGRGDPFRHYPQFNAHLTSMIVGGMQAFAVNPSACLHLTLLKLYKIWDPPIRWRHVAAILVVANRLETLHLVNVDWQWTHNTFTVTLAHLREFFISCDNDHQARIVSHLHMPQIHRVAISSIGDLHPFIECNPEMLRIPHHVALVFHGSVPPQLGQLFSHFPNTATFDFRRSCVTDDLQVLGNVLAGRPQDHPLKIVQVDVYLTNADAAALLGRSGDQISLLSKLPGEAERSVRWISTGGTVTSHITSRLPRIDSMQDFNAMYPDI
ncbi:hypothetical protein B0H11DRAFT_1931120 [Mycena galericulata]|nr:hypothetical protein B0H11DRAFT_1931120 [Mycena galericulata]